MLTVLFVDTALTTTKAGVTTVPTRISSTSSTTDELLSLTTETTGSDGSAETISATSGYCIIDYMSCSLVKVSRYTVLHTLLTQ